MVAWRGARVDPTDLDEVPEPDSTSQGLDLPRMTFVPPPELPTPEYASLQARAIALGIDALVWLAAVVPLGIIYGGISSSNGLFRINISGPPLLMATVLWLAYMTLMEAKYGGSVGKRARGLRVVMEDGEPVTPEAALTRNLMRFLDACPYVVPYLVGAVAVSNSPRMQRFGDRVAETMVVVSSPASSDPGAAGLPPLLPPLGSDPPQVPSTRRKHRRLAVVVVTLLVVVVGGAVAAFLLMRGAS
jgi:uncharacterized RDD family membrane protein YckC